MNVLYEENGSFKLGTVLAEWLALGWALRDERMSSVLVGASSPEQLPALMAAPSLELTEAEVAALDAASRPFA